MPARGEQKPDIVLAAAAGGHLELLLAIAPFLDGLHRAWVTLPGARADALRGDGEVVWTVTNTNRRELNIRNPLQGARLAKLLRPRVVVTSGAGNMLSLALAARALGARLIFIETMARVTTSSAAGRTLAPLSDSVLVQWPELLSHYRQAIVCAPLLLQPRDSIPELGSGTFVSAGTHSRPFDRLLRIVDDAASRGLLPGPVTVQAGVSSYRSDAFACVDWMTPDQLTQHVRAARYVVAHAGGGIAAEAIRAGRRPMLLPRLASEGEHVDDHQRELLRKLSDNGLAVPIGDCIAFGDLAAADEPMPARVGEGNLPHLGVEVRQAVERLLAR
jgi:UDP-N-acetylglucosamine transferase subunit ALG13